MKLLNFVVVLFLTCLTSQADDWPQWMGPDRDNVWKESDIMNRFPEGGPKLIWRVPLAGGYAGPAVANGRVYVTDYLTKENVKVGNFERKTFTGIERVHCLDERTGEQLWTHDYPVEYTISYPAGPRCTPIVDDGRVFTLGAEGHLVCFDEADGQILWSKHLPEDYATKTPLWGYAAHPLIDGEKLICLVGGEGTHVVAFEKSTGKELWRSLSSTEQGYAPPTMITAGGKRQLILAKPNEVASIDPDSGRPFWSVPYEATNGSIIMTPMHVGEYLYVAGYSKKNLLLRLADDRPAAEVVWQDLNRQAVSPVNVQPFADGNTLYGMDQGGLLCGVDLASGKRLWTTGWPLSERPVQTGTAFIVRQADRYWLFNEKGELIIAKLSPEGHEEIDRAKIIEPTNVAFGRKVVWCAPAFANRRLYVRNDQECICVDLAR